MGQAATVDLRRHASRVVVIGILGVTAMVAVAVAQPTSPTAWGLAAAIGVSFGVVVSQPMLVSHRGHVIRVDAGAFPMMLGIVLLPLPALVLALTGGLAVGWSVGRLTDHLPVHTPTAVLKVAANLSTNLLYVAVATGVHLALVGGLGLPAEVSVTVGVLVGELVSAWAIAFIIGEGGESVRAAYVPVLRTPPIWLTLLVGAMMVGVADSPSAAIAWLAIGSASLWILGRHQERQQAELDQLRALGQVSHDLATVTDGQHVEQVLLDRARVLTHATTASLDPDPSPEPSFAVPLDVDGTRWLAVHERTGGGEAFRPSERAMLERLAAIGGLALERLRLTEELRHAATHDQLTGVLSRRGLEQHWVAATRRAARHGRSLGVVYVDLDRFKQINDTQGHAAGDAVLRETAQRLLGVARDADLVCRMGGDEFLLVAEDVAGQEDVEALARRAREAMAVEPAIAASVGVARHPDDGASLDDVVSSADARMYREKRAARHALVVGDGA